MRNANAINEQRNQRELAAIYFESTASRWEELYENAEPSVYAAIYRRRLAVALSFAKGLQLPAGARALDIGCGPGVAALSLAHSGLEVHASDLVEQQLARTRQRAEAAGISHRVSTSVEDIHALSFADESFDLVFVVGVLEWLEDPTKGLREIARVLKPGGRAVLSVDNKWALHNVLDPFSTPPLARFKRGIVDLLDATGLRRKKAAPRDYAYSLAQFDELTSRAGLARTDGRTVGFGPFSVFRLEMPEALGVRLDATLQRLADRGVPILKHGGFVHITVVQKSDHAR
jgi:ubiquinone/menaquinone biosynthesis C-methylase UbiE